MKKLTTLLAMLIALNVFGEDSKTNKPNPAMERQAKEVKWNNFVNTQPKLKLHVQQLATYKAELVKAKADLEYLHALDGANTMATTGEQHVRYGGGVTMSKIEQGKADSRQKEISKAYARVNQLDLNVRTTTGLVQIERLKWEKAMEKQ